MKKLIAMLLAATMVIGLVGCGGGDKQPAETAGSASAEATDLEDFSIVLDWYPNAIHTYLYVAQEKGYFAEEGLNLKVNFPANTNDGISMPAAGKADVGIYYIHDAITTAVEEDVPIVSIGAVTQKMLNVFIALEETGIESPKDLGGKKIGYGGTALSEAITAQALENVGLSADDCEFVDVGFDLMNSMTTNQVDATIGCMVNHEVPQMEEEGFKVNYFSPTDYGVPQAYEFVFLANEDAVEENPDKYKAFLRACQKGYEFMKENPEEALQILLDNQNEENFPLNKEVETKSMETILPVMETENAPFLHQDIEVWQTTADWLHERGLLKEQTDVSDLFVNLLEEDNEKCTSHHCEHTRKWAVAKAAAHFCVESIS